MTCRAPQPPLDPLIEPWSAGQVIHVIHDAAYEPGSFNPGVDSAGTLRNPTRFAPIRNAKGRVVPYLYGGSSRDCAIFETVFHNVPIEAPDKFVDLPIWAPATVATSVSPSPTPRSTGPALSQALKVLSVAIFSNPVVARPPARSVG